MASVAITSNTAPIKYNGNSVVNGVETFNYTITMPLTISATLGINLQISQTFTIDAN